MNKLSILLNVKSYLIKKNAAQFWKSTVSGSVRTGARSIWQQFQIHWANTACTNPISVQIRPLLVLFRYMHNVTLWFALNFQEKVSASSD